MGTVDLSIRTVRRLVLAGACSVGLVVGLAAAPASAQDQHSGGESPNDSPLDPGIKAEGISESSGGGGGLPVTGSDVAGLVALGAAAVAVGSGAIVVSKRHARPSA